MPLICPLCSRPNPVEALYCYHDGAAVGGADRADGPICVGLQPFPSPFVFPSGRFCRTFNELVLACEAQWEEARDLLGEGLLESFFSGLGRADLSWAARRCAGEPDADVSLDRLLSQLPGDARKPALLAVQPLAVNLGRLARGAGPRVVVHLLNQGMGLLRGSVTCDDAEWLELGEGAGAPNKVFQFRNDQAVTVRIVGRRLRAGGRAQEGRLVIETNGGAAVVVLRVEPPAVVPFGPGVLAGAESPRQLAEKTREAPREAAPFFESGAVARWYEANGWTYPVQGPQASGVAALQQFYEALGLAPAPRVELDRQSLRLEGAPGASLEDAVVVRTREKRPVFAHATTSVPWLSVGRTVLSGRSARIPVRVRETPDRPGECLVGQVQVTANGNQRFVVEVALSVAAVLPAPEQIDASAPARPWRGPVLRTERRRPARPGLLAWLLAGACLTLAVTAVLAVVCLTSAGDAAPSPAVAQPSSSSARPPTPALKEDEKPAPAPPQPAPPPPPSQDLTDLTWSLDSDDAAERVSAVRKLAALGPQAVPAIHAILTAMKGGGADFRREALLALPKIGAPTRTDVDPLAALAGDAAFPEGQLYALDALLALGADARPAAVALCVALKNGNPAARRKAADALGALGPEVRGMARMDLIDALRDADPEASAAAAAALAKMGPETPADAPTLQSLLKDPAEAARRFALNGFRALGPAAADFAPYLDDSIAGDASPALRRLAVSALLAMRPAARRSIDAYTGALADADPDVRRTAAAALTTVGVEGGALPGLIRALRSDDDMVRTDAEDALKAARLDKKQVAEIGEALRAQDATLRLRLMELLRPLKADAEPAVPGLIAVLRDGPGEPRRQAAVVLEAMGPAGRKAGAALDDLLQDEKFTVRLDAATALAAVEGADAEEALPVLIDALRVEKIDDAEEAAERDRAVEALAHVGEPAVKPLLSALENDFAGGGLQTLRGKVNALARLAALKALAEIGAAAKSPKTTAVLFEMSRSDPSREVRNAARQARAIIQKAADGG